MSFEIYPISTCPKDQVVVLFKERADPFTGYYCSANNTFEFIKEQFETPQDEVIMERIADEQIIGWLPLPNVRYDVWSKLINSSQ